MKIKGWKLRNMIFFFVNLFIHDYQHQKLWFSTQDWSPTTTTQCSRQPYIEMSFNVCSNGDYHPWCADVHVVSAMRVMVQSIYLSRQSIAFYANISIQKLRLHSQHEMLVFGNWKIVLHLFSCLLVFFWVIIGSFDVLWCLYVPFNIRKWFCFLWSSFVSHW